MNIMQTITDYLRNTTMTTQGDFLVRGAAIAERLAAGAVGTILRGKGAGATPAYEDCTGAIGTILKGAGAGVVPTWGVPSLGNMNMAAGQFILAATGPVSISGLGFQPSLIFFLAHDTNGTTISLSWGVDNGTFKHTMHIYDGAAGVGDQQIQSIYMRRSMGNSIESHVDSMDADGFTLACTETGSASATVRYLAIG